MKVVILDGSTREEMQTARTVVEELLQARGHRIRTIILKEKEIAECTGCFACWDRTPGRCVIPDDGIEVASEVVTSDILILLTPVTFGGYSYPLKNALDRCIAISLPYLRIMGGEVHHPRRYTHKQRLVVIGYLPARDGEAQQVFAQLVERNSHNIQPAGWAHGLVFQDETSEMSAIAVREALIKAGVKL